jgi:hypothetical protein
MAVPTTEQPPDIQMATESEVSTRIHLKLAVLLLCDFITSRLYDFKEIFLHVTSMVTKAGR